MKFYKNQGLNVNDFSTINQERIKIQPHTGRMIRLHMTLPAVTLEWPFGSKMEIIVSEGIRKWYSIY